MELVSKQADSRAEVRAKLVRLTAPELDAAGRGYDKRRHQSDQRRLAGSVRTEEADDVAGVCAEREPGERSAAAEVPRDVGQLDGREVDAHAARPAGPGTMSIGSSVSRAP